MSLLYTHAAGPAYAGRKTEVMEPFPWPAAYLPEGIRVRSHAAPSFNPSRSRRSVVNVFILTHYARAPIEMEGGTTFHFITGGIHEALDRAREAAGEKDVRIGGGPATVRQYLREGLIDELHVAIAPVLLGRGEPLWEGLDLRALGYECVEFVGAEKATHVVLRRVPKDS